MSEEVEKKEEENKVKQRNLKLQLIAIVWAIGGIVYFVPFPVLSKLSVVQGAFLAVILSVGVWLWDV